MRFIPDSDFNIRSVVYLYCLVSNAVLAPGGFKYSQAVFPAAGVCENTHMGDAILIPYKYKTVQISSLL